MSLINNAVSSLYAGQTPPPKASSKTTPTQWKISDGSFKGVLFHVAIPTIAANYGMMSQEIKTERRLQVSEKPGLDGAEVEDFGRKARTFSAEIVFFGPDYLDNLTSFEALLNEGTSGTLILPDIKEAVNAKFQSEGRRTTTETMTVLSLSFIEDNLISPVSSQAVTQSLAIAALATNNPAAAVPTIASKGNQIIAAANAATALLNNNPVLNAIQAANNAVVGVTSTINSVLNIARSTRQTIIGLVAESKNNIANLQAVVQQVMNFSSLLTLPSTTTTSSQAVATSTNSGLDSVDFQAVTAPQTSTVNGVDQVEVTASTQAQVSSMADGQSQLETLLVALQGNRQGLETNTSGNTTDYTAQSINMENFVIDLIQMIAPPPPVKVFSTIMSSLMEICAQNNLDPSVINSVYINNTQLEDILAIPPYTVVEIPSFLVLNT
jgi:prophage DNA circulation protein